MGQEGQELLLKAIFNRDKKKIVELLDLHATVNTSATHPSTNHSTTEHTNHSAQQTPAKSKSQVHVNEPDPRGLTALMLAIEQSDPDIVELLLAKGANPHIKEKHLNLNALMKAISQGNREITEMLLKVPTIKDSPWILSNAVCHAAKECQSEILTLLLSIYRAPNLPTGGEISLFWGRDSGNDTIVKTLCDHFGDEAQQRKNDPELSSYLDRCRIIKEYGEIFGLKTKIKVKFPNTKHYELIATEGLFMHDAILLLAEVLKRYINTRSPHEKTQAFLQTIHEALCNEANFLKKGGKASAQELVQYANDQRLVILPAGWHRHDFNIGIYKNWLVFPGSAFKPTEDNFLLFAMIKPLTPDYVLEIRSTRAHDNESIMLPRLLSIVDPNSALTLPLLDPKGIDPKITEPKFKKAAFANAKNSILALLYLLRLEELKAILSGYDPKEKAVLHEMGIQDLNAAKKAAFGYARHEYRFFASWLRDQKLKELIEQYNNPLVHPEDFKIYRDLLIELLAHYGHLIHTKSQLLSEQFHPSHIKSGLKRIRLIMNALKEHDKNDAIEALNNDKLDLLSPFLRIQDFDTLQILIKAGASFGLTLRCAAETNDLQLLSCLSNIDLSQKINDTDEDGDTALMIAARHGHYDVAKFLLEKGADPSVTKLRSKETALSIAKNRSDACMVKLLSGFEGNRQSVSTVNRF